MNMFITKKQIIGAILITCLAYLGFNEIFTDKLIIGNITITDSLNGFAKFNHGIYSDSNIYSRLGGIYSGEQIQSPAGLSFASSGNFIDDDGFDMTYSGVNNTSIHRFYAGTKELIEIDSSKGLKVLTHLTLPTVETPIRPADKEAKFYIKGAKLILYYLDGVNERYYYLDLSGAVNSEWIYSESEP